MHYVVRVVWWCRSHLLFTLYKLHKSDILSRMVVHSPRLSLFLSPLLAVVVVVVVVVPVLRLVVVVRRVLRKVHLRLMCILQ